MKKLVYEDINLKTHFAYKIYSCGYSLSELKYLVYEYNADGRLRSVAEYTSYDNARKLVSKKCEVTQ